MFIGHIGVALALKKLEPKTNLGTLVFTSLLLDILLGGFVLAGLEMIIVPVNYAQLHYLMFIFPYSHSLIAAVVWSALVFFITYIILKNSDYRYRLKSSLIIGGAVFIHWCCDWLEHPAQLPLTGSHSHFVGLGLWEHLELALMLEVSLMLIGLVMYLSAAKHINKKARWILISIMLLLTTMAVIGQATVVQPPRPVDVAISILLQAIVISGIALWLDRKRSDVAQYRDSNDDKN